MTGIDILKQLNIIITLSLMNYACLRPATLAVTVQSVQAHMVILSNDIMKLAKSKRVKCIHAVLPKQSMR